MKILSVALIALIVFAVVFWGFFYYSMYIARETATVLTATSTAVFSPTKPVSKVSVPTMTVPTGFHGPTSQPNMHGPSGPPPNY